MPGIFDAFRKRSYRFQWPADLLTSWAFEMETLILGWFILIETDSVMLLAIFAALQFGGTLLSPFFGVIADRVNRRTMLIVLRLGYALLAGIIMTLGLIGKVEPWQLFVIATISGLIRPSDLVVRNSLIADMFAAEGLHNAMSLSRTTMDTARIAGSLLGAGLLSTIGIGAAYGAVVGFYIASVMLASGISVSRSLEPASTNPWQELKSGFTYIRSNNTMVAIICLAFVINLTAFPITHGLLPVVARNVYELDENGLARLVAFYAFGALMGSMMIASLAGGNRPGRVTVLFTLAWYLLVILFGHTTSAHVGAVVIVFIGAAQSFSMISMSVLLLATADQSYRGRVSGVRMLAVYGLPLGLVAGGALIEWMGITTTFTVFGAAGFVGTLAIVMKWPVLIRS